MSDDSLRSRLEQLSDKELEQLAAAKEENPSLWQRVVQVLDRVSTAIDPQTYTDKLSERLSESPDKTVAPSKPEEPPSVGEPPTQEPTSTPPPSFDAPTVSDTRPGDVYRARMVDVEPPKLQDFKFGQELDVKQKEAIEAELAKLQPNRYEKILEQGERDLSKLKVAPEVYQQYKDTLDKAYSEYKEETDRIRKAELWSGITKALGYLVMARFSNNTLSPTQYGWKDFDANRYLTEAKNDLNAKLDIAKAKLTEDRQAASEERQLDAIRERDKDKLMEAQERDRLERKRDLELMRQNLDQEANRKLQLLMQQQNAAINAYNMQVSRNERLFRYAEQADAKAEAKALDAQAKAAAQVQKTLQGLEKAQKEAANKMDAAIQKLPNNIKSVLENKKIKDEAKLEYIRGYLTNTKAFSENAKKDILDSMESSWLIFKKIDKDALLGKVNVYIEQEANPTILRLRAGQQPILLQDRQGNQVSILPSKFVDPEVQKVIQEEGLQLVPSY